MTGGWAGYAWPPAIAMASAMFVFLLDFAAERYVEKKYGFMHGSTGGERAAVSRPGEGMGEDVSVHFVNFL